MFFIIGLGNPGPGYAATRHNIGFMAVDRLAEKAGADKSRKWKTDPSCVWLETRLGNTDVILAKPTTFMNRSGLAARRLLDAFEEGPESLLIICDDCELPFGKLRLRRSGGGGGQKGLASIIERIGTTEFKRLRLGIGKPQKPEEVGSEGTNEGGREGSREGSREGDLSGYVLSPFAPDEHDTLIEELAQAARAVEAVITEGIESAMNTFN